MLRIVAFLGSVKPASSLDQKSKRLIVIALTTAKRQKIATGSPILLLPNNASTTEIAQPWTRQNAMIATLARPLVRMPCAVCLVFAREPRLVTLRQTVKNTVRRIALTPEIAPGTASIPTSVTAFCIPSASLRNPPVASMEKEIATHIQITMTLIQVFKS